eukprot:1192169-Prorocentrum_minimum.AAC.1
MASASTPSRMARRPRAPVLCLMACAATARSASSVTRSAAPFIPSSACGGGGGGGQEEDARGFEGVLQGVWRGLREAWSAAPH